MVSIFLSVFSRRARAKAVDTNYGYEASVDKIVLASGSISNVTFNNNRDVVFKIGDGQLVINNVVGRTVKIVNSAGKIVDNGLYEP